MLIAPNRKRNCLWSDFFKICEPITAACDAPKPGRNAVNGDAITDAREDFKIDFFDSLILVSFVVFCLGIFVFCRILMIRLLAPNNPVSSGKRDSLIFKFKEAIPKKPARRKMNNAQKILFFCFSVQIK